MNRRTLLTQVIPCGLGSLGVLALIPGCGPKKAGDKEEAIPEEKEDAYYEQEEKMKESDEEAPPPDSETAGE